MKNKIAKLMFLSIIFFSVSLSVSAQRIYVKIRPVAPAIVVVPQPSHIHVWIGEEWEPNGNSYRYTGGHWDTPPHEGDVWNQGHWRHRGSRGHEWVRGGWHGKRR